MSSIPPNTALYIRNLNDKVKKEELRRQLYSLFTPYGKVISVVAQKGPKMKGQAFVVFRDLAAATTALRSMDGELFYEKKMHIEYAKTQSYATRKLEDPNFVPPKFMKISAEAAAVAAAMSKVTVSHAQEDNERKRGRDEEMADGASPEKKQKDADDDEMDMEVEEQQARPISTNPSSMLRCENLPAEVTDDVLAVLFQQYPGFQATQVSAAMGSNKSKVAVVRYDQVDQATIAKEALDGFTLKKGWVHAIESANINANTMDAMRQGAEALRIIHGDTTIERVDATMDSIREQMELTNEISGLISDPMNLGIENNDEELKAQLAELEAEKLDEVLGRVERVPQHVPSVPTAETSKQREQESEEDRELRELQASLAM
ncbi:hypothetical protein FRB99_002829 [Tulasnella sp. 403]|nr:hypothetical protein FRB99_002829 [Tulasnella sp. 403]